MKRKKSASIASKKEPIQPVKQEFLPSWMSFKLLIVLLLLLAGIIWFGFYATHTKEVSGSDDREYASIARNIVNGKGIVRNLIYPVDINFFQKLPVPEFMHPPGYPLILAGFFKMFGMSDFVVLLPSYLSYFFLLILLFYFVRKYLDIKTASLAAVVLIFNKEILDASLVALSEAVYTLAFFLFFVFLANAKSLRSVFIAGILLGVSHLIRENIYPFLIPLLVYLYFYPDLPRWKKMTLFIIGFLIPLIPNIFRSFINTGSFFFSYGKFTFMAFTTKYPWLNVYRDIQNPSLLEFLTRDPSPFLLKYVINVVNAVLQFTSVTNPYVLVFFVLGMFHRSPSPEWRRIKLLFLSLLILQIFFVALFIFNARFFIPFVPMMIALAVESFVRSSKDLISGAKPNWRKGVLYISVILFLVFFIIPTSAYTILHPGKPWSSGDKIQQYGFRIPHEEAKKLNDFLKSELKEGQVVWTNLPEILEWEGDRLCGWLPVRAEHLDEIQKRIPVDAVLLMNIQTPTSAEEEWRFFLSGERNLPQYRNVKLYKSSVLNGKLFVRGGKN